MARRNIQNATAIIDGEVIRPSAGRQPSLVRAEHVLRGPQQELFQIGQQDSCDVTLSSGERLRLILTGGPETYFLRIDYSYAREEDSMLGSDRRSVWPFFPGTSE